MVRLEFVESRRAFLQLSPIDTDPVSLRKGGEEQDTTRLYWVRAGHKMLEGVGRLGKRVLR